MAEQQLPERPRSHQLDDEAARAVAQFFKPHIVEERGKHDYGKDLVVRFVHHDGTSHKVSGRDISVQVKGSDAPPSASEVVRVKSLNSWFNAFEPVLLAKAFQPETSSARIRGAWIDEALRIQLDRSSPGWRQQETVTLPLELELTQAQLIEIERYVGSWRGRGAGVAWDVAEFAAIEQESSGIAAELEALSSAAGVEGPLSALRAASRNLRRLAYNVALLGSSRVGKSTLLNHLLGRDLSPVRQLPTTAVVMSVRAGERDEATVHFLEGEPKTGPATAEFVGPFVTQQDNPNNEKRVAHVEVHVSDPILSAGIALLDLPGFHDADPEIRAVSAAALERVDAALYLIDIAPYKSGSFSFSAQHVGDLEALLGSCERLVLVLSKADMLKRADRKAALDYVNAQLGKYGLLPRLVAPPMMLGVSQKLEGGAERKRSPAWLTADELKAEVWRILLRDGAVASARVHERFSGIIGAHQDLVRAVQVRLVDAKRADALLGKLDFVAAEVERIKARVSSRRDQILANSSARVVSRAAAMLAAAEGWIRAIPANVPLPESKDVRARLYTDAQQLFAGECAAVARELADVKLDAERKIETALEQLPIGPLKGVPTVSSPDIPEIQPFPLSALQEGLWGTVSIGALSWFFGGPVTAGLSLLGFILGIVLRGEKARVRDVENRIETIRRLGPKVQAQVNAQIRRLSLTVCDEVTSRAAERGRYAVHDLKKSLRAAGQPILPEQQAQFVRSLDQLKLLGERLQSVYARVMRATGVPVKVSAGAAN